MLTSHNTLKEEIFNYLCDIIIQEGFAVVSEDASDEKSGEIDDENGSKIWTSCQFDLDISETF